MRHTLLHKILRLLGFSAFAIVLATVVLVIALSVQCSLANRAKTYRVTGIVYEWVNATSPYTMVYNAGDINISGKELVPLSGATIHFVAFGQTGNPIDLFSLESGPDGTFDSGIVTTKRPGSITVSKVGYNTGSQTGLNFTGEQLVVIMVKK